MRAVVGIAVIAALLASSAAAASISWTGFGNNNQWNTPVNWNGDQVPGPNDDVTIPSGVVQITTPVSVNSLVMGTQFDSPANLTIFSTFAVVQQVTVEGNGNLFINSGAASVSGTIDVAGQLYFESGAISGSWTVSSKGAAFLNSGAQKVFTGAQFIAKGELQLSGVVVLNQSSVITISSAATASGNFDIQAQDNTQVLFDASAGSLTYQGGGTFQIQAPASFGTFTLSAGNLTLFDNIAFTTSFAIPSGSYVATVGSASVNMTGGVTGNGVLTAEGALLSVANLNLAGAFNIGGNVQIGGTANSVGILTVFGGTATLASAVSTPQLNLLSGTVVGAAGIQAVKGLINSQGVSVSSPISFSGVATVQGASTIAFGAAGSITVTAAGSLTVPPAASLVFTGNAASAGVANQGTINAQGPITFQTISLTGAGTLSASATVIATTSATFQQQTVTLTGAGELKGANSGLQIATVSATPGVSARLAEFLLSCGASCTSVSSPSTSADSFHFVVSS